MELSTIISQLRTVADPQRKEAAKTYFPTDMEVLGVRGPDLKNLIHKWWDDLKAWSPQQLLTFAKELVNTKVFECNQLAFELLWKNKKALNLLSLRDLEELGHNMDNWASVDAFSVMLSGWAWRNNQIADDDVLNWLESGNRWWRRAAVVSTVGLNLKSRGGKGDTPRTLMVCQKVVADRDELLVKALSWALRELSKNDKRSVENFMVQHKANMAGRVVREVNMKLTTGRKNAMNH